MARSEHDGSEPPSGAFGPNWWLVEEMYEAYRADPQSVSESWRDFFASAPAGAAAPVGTAVIAGAGTPGGAIGPSAATAVADGPAPAVAGPAPGPAGPAPAAAGPAPAPAGASAVPTEPAPRASEDVVTPLRGAAARLAENMTASLVVPTATSVHPVPAKLLEVNRQILNGHLARTSGGKVSFTHLIAWAVVRAIGFVPAIGSTFVEDADGKGTPGVVHHEHVGLGIAIDVERPGSRMLLVPCIRDADTLDFAAFLRRYEELVRKARTGKLAVADFAGVTVTITNPGTLGTSQSVPRLLPGQGAIIGVGSLGLPPEYSAADPAVVAELGIGKVVNITSTYDHRIIQGAESGLFLTRVHELLIGEHGFYDEVFGSIGVPYHPARWHADENPVDRSIDRDRARLVKQGHVQTLINMYRVRGHLMANLDPLETHPRALHPELDPLTYGLTVWDLDREFVTDGLGNSDVLPLAEIMRILRDAYCRTVGVEYMHIQDPDQKRWIQANVEGVPATLEPDEQRHILERLNAAEAFESFLNARYLGQKRFGLEGAESVIPLVDALLSEAAEAGMAEAVLGMAHRGRLNVLANIVGKSYGEIFAEFEGEVDPETFQGSGDVKYHKGSSGKFIGRRGSQLPVTLASNPSHLEAVDPVVEGMARAKQDQYEPGTFPVLPVLLHGDAAFAGQGVVAETLELSQLRGYRTGGTVHVVINNQLGFTTAPTAARSSVYPTDVAKTVQAPILHVNGDDPEACARVARLAFGFRQAFHKDVVIDMFCYRRHGHNEADDPSYTQPLMYKEIERHRSVRKLYTEALVRRGDITVEEAERALEDFSSRLQTALEETRSTAPPKIDHLPATPEPFELPSLEMATGVDESVLDGIAAALHEVPQGFTVHPKLARQLQVRAELYASGSVDWALGELLAFGSLSVEGVDVRLTGQDTRRGTFSQRHAVLVDYETGTEYVPLESLGSPGRFRVYDSLLSEYAALGFEYGYSVEAAHALVCWEAQFGDFANGAQVAIDNFVAAAADKWGQSSALVLLLPHGYEGQGPEHSSARVERFLTLSAEGNITVAQPTTAAQYFHLLRAQAHRRDRRPLVVLTPKSLLRARSSRSLVEDLATGTWHAVLDDPASHSGTLDGTTVGRIVLCSGKVAFDAIARRDALVARDAAGPGLPPGAPGTAVVRVEQLYPWPEEEVGQVLERYSSAVELVWLQDEPENMGPWSFVHGRLHKLVRERLALRHVSRAESASPATGSSIVHQLEEADLLDRAIGPLG